MNSNVKTIQKMLVAKGFDPGPIDGVAGPKTYGAIIKALNTIGNHELNLRHDWPNWLKVAASYLGVKEIQGNVHDNRILNFWKRLGLNIADDETPWCAGFVGGVLEEFGIRSTRKANARSYANWGVNLSGPAVGCIAVFWRGSPNSLQGHVGFVVGKSKADKLLILGGNQRDEVNVTAFSLDRLLHCKWPVNYDLPKCGFENLPVIENIGKV